MTSAPEDPSGESNDNAPSAEPGTPATPTTGPKHAHVTTTIGEAASRGLRWSLVGTVAMRIVTFTLGLVLARLLSPADFGMYAIALSATQFVMHVNDAGLIAAAVQWRGRFDAMDPTATVLAAAFSTIVYGAFWVVAPSFASLAGSPDAIWMVRIMTATILVDGITAVRSASLMRHFQQHRLITANCAGALTTFVSSISVAIAGGGAYAFAVGQLAGAILTGTLVLVLARVPFLLGFDRAVAVKLLRFGVPLAASLGIEAVLMNADYVIVGRTLGVASLGFYLLAFNTSSWAVGLMTTAIRYVSIPAFSRLSDEESDALSHGVQRSIVLLLTAVTPVIVLTSILAHEMVLVLYGEKWVPAATVLRFLMVLTGIRLFTALVFDVLTGAGATRRILLVNLAWTGTLVPALFCGTRLLGIQGTAIAHCVIGVFVAAPMSLLALRHVGVRLRPIPRTLVRPVLAGCAAGLVTMVVSRITGLVLDPLIADGVALATMCFAGSSGLLCYAAIVIPRASALAWMARVRRPATPRPRHSAAETRRH